jgi:hypothetical protein
MAYGLAYVTSNGHFWSPLAPCRAILTSPAEALNKSLANGEPPTHGTGRKQAEWPLKLPYRAWLSGINPRFPPRARAGA